MGSMETLAVFSIKHAEGSGVTLLLSEEHSDKSAYLRNHNMACSTYYLAPLL